MRKIDVRDASIETVDKIIEQYEAMVEADALDLQEA